MLRQPRKSCVEAFSQGSIGYVFGQRLRHTHHPFVFGAGGDGVGGVAHAHAGVAFFVGVHGGAAEPAAEVFKQVLLAVVQAFGVQFAHLVGFRQLVHEFVKAVYQAAYTSFAAYEVVWGFVGLCCHGGIL